MTSVKRNDIDKKLTFVSFVYYRLGNVHVFERGGRGLVAAGYVCILVGCIVIAAMLFQAKSSATAIVFSLIFIFVGYVVCFARWGVSIDREFQKVYQWWRLPGYEKRVAYNFEQLKKFVLEGPNYYKYDRHYLYLCGPKTKIFLGTFSASEYILGTLSYSDSEYDYKGSKTMKFLAMLGDSLDCFAIPDSLHSFAIRKKGV